MTRRYTRRQLLRSSAVAGVVGVTGCAAPTDPSRSQTGDPESRNTPETDTTTEPEPTTEQMAATNLEPVDVRGALYVPARAWNTYQMWDDYDERIIERDLGYAEKVNLNALRTWVSFEKWHEDPEALERSIEHFLTTANDKGMKPLLGLFESVGKEPTEKNLNNTDPLTAPPVQSPASDVVQNRDMWDEPREFVRWFMDRWKDDDRLLAIEAMNEPGWLPNMKRFSKGMFETMAKNRGSVPLTVGSTSLANNADYIDWGADVLQFHYNFPSNRDLFHDLLPQANQLSEDLDMPVWLTEWQKIADFGWGQNSKVDNWQPDYDSIAPTIHRYGVGNFFWSLMIKPAYVRYMRKRGIINGLFHEDGAVWHRGDAKAIKAMSGEPEIEIEQRQKWPKWALPIKRHARGN